MLSPAQELAYIVIEASDTSAWQAFLTEVIGLRVWRRGDVLGFGMDDAAARVLVVAGDRDDVVTLGVSLSPDSLGHVREQLRQAGVSSHEATEEQCQERAVSQLWSVNAPDGTLVELCTGQVAAPEPYISALVPGGFVTRGQGLGHVVLWSSAPDEATAFWTNHLGWQVSGTLALRTPAGLAELTFLYCNRRHHTLALGTHPTGSGWTPRASHFMVQTQSLDGLGLIMDRVIGNDVPITRTLGRHYGDEMVSFYVTTPSGFELEVGTGAISIDEPWQPAHFEAGSRWGHQMARS